MSTKIHNFDIIKNLLPLLSTQADDKSTSSNDLSIELLVFNNTTTYETHFRERRYLTDLIIPENVYYIGGDAFSGCTSLKSIYCRPITPPLLGERAFTTWSITPTIYVPTHLVDAYKSAVSWSEYASQVVGYNFD